MQYNLNELLSKNKKEVELLDGTTIDLTFTPMIVNRLYSQLTETQFKLQDLMKEYRKHLNKVQEAKSEEELKDTKQYLNKSKKITEEVKELSAEVQDKLKTIISVVAEHNSNDFEVDDDWFNNRTKEEINMLVQIIFDMVKDEDKKK